jgi:pyrimidine operon attenuation protein/uracil phosphoribosyltransferase
MSNKIGQEPRISQVMRINKIKKAKERIFIILRRVLALEVEAGYTHRDLTRKQEKMKTILNAGQIEAIIARAAEETRRAVRNADELAIIGIRSRGEILAQRLCRKLGEIFGQEIPCGTLDITLYRDDINTPRKQPVVRSTEIEFDISDKIIVLVDDVLYTGRSVRAALDALVDLGRPKAIRLAVLVERPGREYPIGPDFVGVKADAEPGQSVQVHLIESDGKDEVVVE